MESYRIYKNLPLTDFMDDVAFVAAKVGYYMEPMLQEVNHLREIVNQKDDCWKDWLITHLQVEIHSHYRSLDRDLAISDFGKYYMFIPLEKPDDEDKDKGVCAVQLTYTTPYPVDLPFGVIGSGESPTSYGNITFVSHEKGENLYQFEVTLVPSGNWSYLDIVKSKNAFLDGGSQDLTDFNEEVACQITGLSIPIKLESVRIHFKGGLMMNLCQRASDFVKL